MISRLDLELPGVTIGLEPDQSAVVFMQEGASRALLSAQVLAALRKVCGTPGWGEHFVLPT